jgi:hypothetical protein
MSGRPDSDKPKLLFPALLAAKDLLMPPGMEHKFSAFSSFRYMLTTPYNVKHAEIYDSLTSLIRGLWALTERDSMETWEFEGYSMSTSLNLPQSERISLKFGREIFPWSWLWPVVKNYSCSSSSSSSIHTLTPRLGRYAGIDYS